MTTMTLSPNATSDPSAYHAGRADASDDAATRTTDELSALAGQITEHHPDFMYGLGYMDRVLELRRQQAKAATQ